MKYALILMLATLGILVPPSSSHAGARKCVFEVNQEQRESKPLMTAEDLAANPFYIPCGEWIFDCGKFCPSGRIPRFHEKKFIRRNHRPITPEEIEDHSRFHSPALEEYLQNFDNVVGRWIAPAQQETVD